jgi:Phytanoyl-CoA dioxygenase (PhyH)
LQVLEPVTISEETLRVQLELDGFAVIPELIDDEECSTLAARLDELQTAAPGSRIFLELDWCRALAGKLRHSAAIDEVLPSDAVAIQCNYFDKSSGKNWLAALHQDLSVPVQNRAASAACSGWSEKEGQIYVQPPSAALEQLLAVRIHVDPCPTESGALRVVPGSHRAGRLNGAQAEKLRAQRGETVVPVLRGGALLMRPLLLHASSKSSAVRPRRVLHFVFGPTQLPEGLAWRYTV